MTAKLLMWCAASYLLGSIPTGYWLGLVWKDIDIRKHGSGNLGATNVFRVLGKWAGLGVLIFDIAKGWIPVHLAMLFFPGRLSIAIAAGLSAIIGHTASLFVRFRGGKGVATSAGVFAALLPTPFLIAIGTFLVVFGLTHYVSAGSLLGAMALAASSFLLSAPPPLAWMSVAVALFVFWTHRANIQRLLKGTENRIEWH